MKGPIVEDFTITKLIPNIPSQYKHLLPTVLVQEKCEFTIRGCNNAVSNAIRRTVLCELKVAHLRCDYGDIETDDPFIIPEMIQKRLQMIPLLQSVPSNATFSVDVTNNTLQPMDVKTGQFHGPKKMFDETYTLLTLGPGRYFRAKIRVGNEYGYTPEHGMCAVAFNAVSICTDAVPINVYTGEGVRSQSADPRVWKISFNTSGTMPSRTIVTSACSAIIGRLKTVLSLLHTIVSSENQYTLTIQGDSDTIGNLLVKTIDEMYPDVIAATYSTPAIDRAVVIKITYNDDINTLYKNVVDNLIKTFEKITDQVKA
jgi:DNA-directed RNA polymerase subunit L